VYPLPNSFTFWSAVILYEYPLNERVRTLLRLERLFARLSLLLEKPDAVDHHFALLTLFEIVDVSARADLKTDLLKDLEKQRAALNAFRGNPQISEATLDQIIGEVESAFAALNAQSGKAGQSIQDNEWLMAIRSRASIPGGTCEFDLPSYYAWQHTATAARAADLARWVAPLAPLYTSLSLLLRLIRDGGVMQKVLAQSGLFQQNLGNRTYQILRLRVDPSLGFIPEMTGHRLMVSVRFMQPDADYRLKTASADVAFEMALCV
jgi:cell division protein ZapD